MSTPPMVLDGSESSSTVEMEASSPSSPSSSSPSQDTELANEEIAANSDGNDEDIGLMEVLRYLLQGNSRGDLRIRLVRNAGENSDDSSDDDSGTPFFNSRRLNHQRVPQPPDSPDTSVIDQSDLKQQMKYELDILNSTRFCTFPSVPGLLCMKEIGNLNGSQTVNLGRRIRAASPYLPTKFYPTRLLKLRDKFFCGVYNKDGDFFMSGCQDSKIRIFDTTKGEWTKLKTIHCKDIGWSILDVDFSHGGNHVIYSSWSEYIHICNIRGDCDTHQDLYLDPGDQYRSGIFSLRFNRDDTEIIAGANGGIIYMYNRDLGKRTMRLHAHDDDLSSVCFADESGHIVYSGGEDGVIKVWDRRNLREESPHPVGQLAGHHDSVTHIDSKNDARYLITNSKDQSIKLWDIRRFASSEGVNATTNAIAKQNWDYRWHPYSGKIVKKKLPGDCSLMTYYGHSVVRTLIRARFSPPFNTGQQYIYSGDGLGRIVIYDLLSGKIVRILEQTYNPKINKTQGHDREVVRDVSWHPYENNLVSSGWDGSIQKWEYNVEED